MWHAQLGQDIHIFGLVCDSTPPSGSMHKLVHLTQSVIDKMSAMRKRVAKIYLPTAECQLYKLAERCTVCFFFFIFVIAGAEQTRHVGGGGGGDSIKKSLTKIPEGSGE